jgi:hypothetical protein
MTISISLMKQQILITHGRTVLQERQKCNRPSTERHLSVLRFSRKYKEEEFCCRHNILTDGVFVTEMSSNAGISV